MLKKTTLSLFFILYSVSSISSQNEAIFKGIKFNDSLNSVIEKVKLISKSTQIINVDEPSFPLAEYKETHLIAKKVKIKNGTLQKVVFTFSDGVLNFITAKGNVEILQLNKKEKPMKYMSFQVYFKELLFLNVKEDKAWFLTQKAAHPNLFTWNNLYLNNKSKTPKYTKSAKLPSFLKMGGAYSEMLANLKKESQYIKVDTLDGKDPKAHIQINSFGVEYAGFPRKFEARFGDNKLNAMWILTAKAEENRIRKQLINAYGNPIFKNKDWEIFNNWTVGLRKDKPEVLFLTQEMGMKYKKDFFKQ
jgi:hypothetical protein